jgi:hypothetical protein
MKPSHRRRRAGGRRGRTASGSTGRTGRGSAGGRPPEVRRLPPRTDDEERRYKLFKAQNDPFLLDQMNVAPCATARARFYDPLISVRPVSVSDPSRYIVQNKDGMVLGHVEIGVELAPMVGCSSSRSETSSSRRPRSPSSPRRTGSTPSH